MKKEFIMIKTWKTEKDDPIIMMDSASQGKMIEAAHEYTKDIKGKILYSVLVLNGYDNEKELLEKENLKTKKIIKEKNWKGKKWFFSKSTVAISEKTGVLRSVFPLSKEEEAIMAELPIRIQDLVKDEYYNN